MVVDHLHPQARTEPSATVVDFADRETGGDEAAGLGCLLDTARIDGSPIGGQGRAAIVVLRMVGEIDLATQDAMETALQGGLQAGPRHLLVDLSRVRFCGAHGLTQLADTARYAAEDDIDYALCGLTPHLNRVARIAWDPDGPNRYRSLAAALTTIRAGHARHEQAHQAGAGFS